MATRSAAGTQPERVAVLLIHGIGEQRPMDTLRGFATGIVPPADDPRIPLYWSKPDAVSRSFELRRLTVPTPEGEPRHDLYEFYWQPLMQEHRWRHVMAWVWRLLRRSPARVPARLRGLWVMVWISLILVGVGAALQKLGAAPEGDWYEVLAWAVPLAFSLVGAGLLGYIGDAARYLNAAPQNITARQAIRTAGMELLERLHAKKYDRILVIGHSLGSVIAYDLVYNYWTRCHIWQPGATEPSQPALAKFEDGADATKVASALQNLQQDVFSELRAQGCEWRISHLITLGSPLTYADFLLADSRQEVSDRLKRREFAACPPRAEFNVDERAMRMTFSRAHVIHAPSDYRYPHHAACFAATRWTNLYYPSRAWLWGDLIGGPIASLLGDGIFDVPLKAHPRGGFFAHTLYWTDALPRNAQASDPALESSAIATIRRALGFKVVPAPEPGVTSAPGRPQSAAA